MKVLLSFMFLILKNKKYMEKVKILNNILRAVRKKLSPLFQCLLSRITTPVSFLSVVGYFFFLHT